MTEIEKALDALLDFGPHEPTVSEKLDRLAAAIEAERQSSEARGWERAREEARELRHQLALWHRRHDHSCPDCVNLRAAITRFVDSTTPTTMRVLRCADCQCGWDEGQYDLDCECRCHTDPTYKPIAPAPTTTPGEPSVDVLGWAVNAHNEEALRRSVPASTPLPHGHRYVVKCDDSDPERRPTSVRCLDCGDELVHPTQALATPSALVGHLDNGSEVRVHLTQDTAPSPPVPTESAAFDESTRKGPIVTCDRHPGQHVFVPPIRGADRCIEAVTAPPSPEETHDP